MFRNLCSPPPFPSLLITALICCCKISLTICFVLSYFSRYFLLFVSAISSKSPISQSNSSSRPAVNSTANVLPLHSLFFFFSSDSCVCVCDAVCACGTSGSSHLKHFTETHICCFRAQRDLPWQRLFEVASQGEPEPERGI